MIEGYFVDILGREIYPAIVHFANGKIIAVEKKEAVAKEQYILPGFVDAHVHIESSMLIHPNLHGWQLSMVRLPQWMIRTRSPTSWEWKAWNT